jgi:hypothetical protein
MFGKKHEKLAPLSKFVRRMVLSVGMAGILMTLALSIGILGYHGLVGFDWVDSLLEVSMILGGMGSGKRFSTFATIER